MRYQKPSWMSNYFFLALARNFNDEGFTEENYGRLFDFYTRLVEGVYNEYSDRYKEIQDRASLLVGIDEDESSESAAAYIMLYQCFISGLEHAYINDVLSRSQEHLEKKNSRIRLLDEIKTNLSHAEKKTKMLIGHANIWSQSPEPLLLKEIEQLIKALEKMRNVENPKYYTTYAGEKKQREGARTNFIRRLSVTTNEFFEETRSGFIADFCEILVPSIGGENPITDRAVDDCLHKWSKVEKEKAYENVGSKYSFINKIR